MISTNSSRYLFTLKRLSLLAVFILLGVTSKLNAASCAATLQPLFDLAAKNDGTGFYATFTSQLATGSANRSRDPVWYANGPVTRQTGFIGFSLRGNLLLLTNSSGFALNPANTMAVTIFNSGLVSVQQKINGIPVGGIPPTTFAASCSAGPIQGTAGLIQGIVGSRSFTISLTTTPPAPVPK